VATGRSLSSCWQQGPILAYNTRWRL